MPRNSRQQRQSARQREARAASPGQTRNGKILYDMAEGISSDSSDSGEELLQWASEQERRNQQARRSNLLSRGRAGASQLDAARGAASQQPSRSTSQRSTSAGPAGRQKPPPRSSSQTSRASEADHGKGKQLAVVQGDVSRPDQRKRGRGRVPRPVPAGAAVSSPSAKMATSRGTSPVVAMQAGNRSPQRLMSAGQSAASPAQHAKQPASISRGPSSSPSIRFWTEEDLQAVVDRQFTYHCPEKQCPRAHDAFPGKRELLKHVPCHARSQAEFQCDKCRAGFERQYDCKRHVSSLR